MKQPDLKNLFDKLEPDAYQETRLRRAVVSAPVPKRRFTIWHGVAAGAVCAAVVIGLLLLSPAPLPGLPAASAPAPGSSAAGEPIAHNFALETYYADGEPLEEIDPNPRGGVMLEEGIRWKYSEEGMRIKRGKLQTLPDGTTQYSMAGYSSFGPQFSVVGEHIAEVSVSCETGKLTAPMTQKRLDAYEKARRIAQEPEDVRDRQYTRPISSFTMKNPLPGADEGDVAAEVYTLWVAGELDDLWMPCVERAGFPAVPAATAAQRYYVLSPKDSGNGELEVQVKFYMLPSAEKNAFTVDCTREGAFLHTKWRAGADLYAAVSQYPPLPYEQLPGDILTIRVTFTDGQTATKRVGISFDSDGYAVAELLS